MRERYDIFEEMEKAVQSGPVTPDELQRAEAKRALRERQLGRVQRMRNYLGPGTNTHRAFIEGPSYEIEPLASGPEDFVIKHLDGWLDKYPLQPGHRAFVVKVVDCFDGPELVD
ncbi:hypothetical protein KHQ84_gp172 [Rhodococcus phage Finch]|uniref:Uncharacterized protein n=1 Tax=Rhodococcus phage Finch TaxID=2094144 RepID=A0A2P1JXS4_9CAUD|nr:hypothetical protein KHQ84_gp172 [Rhodococcus phage Finch]AVO25100.1 hypothetical protein SEA_FINCH_172 [Rhodococcus phage Finch]